jgi:ribosome biogenesis protein SSF1/2
LARSAVKLSELGPRLSLKLFKVERGLCEGDIMYHGVEKRTPEEVSMPIP